MVDDCSPQVLPVVDADNPSSNGPSNHIDNTYLLVAKHLLDNIPEASSFAVVVVASSPRSSRHWNLFQHTFWHVR